MKAPRPKKAKILSGELLIRYSGREWPIKKNGPLVGNEDFLNGISDLLKEISIQNIKDLSWSTEQRDIKDTVTIAVGSSLAQELIDRGWAHLS